MTIKINKEKCKSCRLCVSVCPLQLVKVSDSLNKKGYKYCEMDSDKCSSCGLCARMCPDECIILTVPFVPSETDVFCFVMWYFD